MFEKRVILLKVLYYLFFTILVIIALLIFMEIIDFPFYDRYLAGFFRRILNIFGP